MDCDQNTTLKNDELAAKIFKMDGSYVETSAKDRYTAGFNDILQKHFLQAKTLPEK